MPSWPGMRYRAAGRRDGQPHPQAGGPEGNRPRAGHAAGLGGVRPAVPRPPGAGRLCGADRHPLRQRRQAARARHRQGGQPSPARGAGRAGLAVAPLPAGQRTRRMVSASYAGRGRAHPQGDDRRPGAEALRGPVALLPGRDDPGRRGVEDRAGIGRERRRLARRSPLKHPRLAACRRLPRTFQGAATQNGAATLGSSSRMPGSWCRISRSVRIRGWQEADLPYG